MILRFDGDEQRPEIQICGKALEIKTFGEQLVNEFNDFIINSTGKGNEYYPVLLEKLKCYLDNSLPEPSLVKVKLNNKTLEISGSIDGLKKLGQSCINFFSQAENGEHMHLDYFEGNLLLAETNCSLIFVCEERC